MSVEIILTEEGAMVVVQRDSGEVATFAITLEEYERMTAALERPEPG